MAAPCTNIAARHDAAPSVLHIAADELEPGAPRPPAEELPAEDDAVLAALVGRIVYQDEAALAELYRQCAARLYRYALRFAADAGTAEEVVEDVFWQAWRQAPRFDATRGSVLAWLTQMARSRAIDARRAAGRNPLHGADELDDSVNALAAEDDADPRAQLDAAQLARQMDAALARLDPLRRQLVSLAFQRGCTQAEIAEQTGLPLGTVKSHLRRALAQMKESIDPSLHGALPERPS